MEDKKKIDSRVLFRVFLIYIYILLYYILFIYKLQVKKYINIY